MADAWSVGRRGRLWVAVPLAALFAVLGYSQWGDDQGSRPGAFAHPSVPLPEGTARYADCGKSQPRRTAGKGLVPASYGYSGGGRKNEDARFHVDLGLTAPSGEKLGPTTAFRVGVEFWGAHGEGLLARARGLHPKAPDWWLDSTGPSPDASPSPIPSARPGGRVALTVELPLGAVCRGRDFSDLLGPPDSNDAADTPPILVTVDDPATGQHFATTWPPEEHEAPTLEASFTR